jgi:hypothetical protein
MFASKGETVAPCGVPSSAFAHAPASITPALNHFWMRRSIRLSAILCSMNFTSHP